jgi:hypothetical protein
VVNRISYQQSLYYLLEQAWCVVPGPIPRLVEQFSFLVGNVNPEFYVRGPLISFPINLEFKQEGKQPGWYIVFPEDGKPILNRALMEAIKKKGGPNLTESFPDDLVFMFLALVISNMKYCPKIYTDDIVMKSTIPQKVTVCLLTISATTLIDTSTSSATNTIKKITKNLFLSYFRETLFKIFKNSNRNS